MLPLGGAIALPLRKIVLFALSLEERGTPTCLLYDH